MRSCSRPTNPLSRATLRLHYRHSECLSPVVLRDRAASKWACLTHFVHRTTSSARPPDHLTHGDPLLTRQSFTAQAPRVLVNRPHPQSHRPAKYDQILANESTNLLVVQSNAVCEAFRVWLLFEFPSGSHHCVRGSTNKSSKVK